MERKAGEASHVHVQSGPVTNSKTVTEMRFGEAAPIWHGPSPEEVRDVASCLD